MNYFIDTEFLEGKQRERFPISLFRKETKPTIDLISIGIVSEGITKTLMKPCDVYNETVNYSREYYAISKDFNLKEAWNRFDLKDVVENHPRISRKEKVYWIRENVLKPIFIELFIKDNNLNYEALKDKFETIGNKMDYKWLKSLINKHGKTNKEIAEEIKIFIANRPDNKTHKDILENEYLREKPKFYAYYADYDWVAFCWLFGKMMNLPKGFPMYCRDLKQSVDDLISKTWEDVSLSTWGHEGITLEKLKNHPDYPKQQNEHNALDDARWNKELYKFLNNFK